MLKRPPPPTHPNSKSQLPPTTRFLLLQALAEPNLTWYNTWQFTTLKNLVVKRISFNLRDLEQAFSYYLNLISAVEETVLFVE